MTEIAPCPMPGCGGECRLVDCTERTYWITCKACNYTSNVFHAKRDAITAHNALCADVTLARNLRSALGVHLAMRISDNAGGTLPRFEVQAFENVPPDGGGSIVYRRDTLDAALAELAKKIGGSE